jgi:hypothetical protein
MDSIKKKPAIHGIRKDNTLAWCFLNILIYIMISVISQDRLRRGTTKNRNSSTANPESRRLNPKIKSNAAPI